MNRSANYEEAVVTMKEFVLTDKMRKEIKDRLGIPGWVAELVAAYDKAVKSRSTLASLLAEKDELLDQCIILLSSVCPDIHKKVLRDAGISQKQFDALFKGKSEHGSRNGIAT